MMSDSRSGRSGKVCGMAVLWLAVLMMQQQVFARDQDVASADSPLRRYLLVASEGLYEVEPDGSCSWSYNPEPYKGQGWIAT